MPICSRCENERPRGDFTASQLKAGGRRRCKSCANGKEPVEPPKEQPMVACLPEFIAHCLPPAQQPHALAQVEWGSPASLAETSRAAAAAALPPLDAQNAAQYPPPPLSSFRGVAKKAKRNAADGPPVLWYFQMTGRDWDREASTYHAACEAYRRLCKDGEQLRASERARKANDADHERAFVAKFESLDPDEMFGGSYGIVAVADFVRNRAPHRMPEGLASELPTLQDTLPELKKWLKENASSKAISVRSERLEAVGPLFFLCVRMLCELEDSVGAEGLDPDDDARLKVGFRVRCERI
eukprot:4768828-Prymnesium_polylepis.1